MAGIFAFFSAPDMPMLMAMILAGVLVGYVVGALPGFDITTGVAVLLPLSYVMGQAEALAFFSAMYCAGVFAGSITAILFRIPGTSESVMSAIEGYPFTQQGQPGFALGIAIVCSGAAGIAASFVLMTLAPALANIGLQFGPGDYAALGLLGCVAVVSASGESTSKSVLALLLGLFLSTVGADPVTGEYRFVVVTALEDGIGLVPAIIGLFAVSDVMWRILIKDFPLPDWKMLSRKWRFPKLFDYAKIVPTFIRSWLIGLFTGVLPGAGASSAAFIAHSLEARFSGKNAKFGNANALAAPETAKNAAAVGALIPLLALGIPGSGTAAVILGAFEIHNLSVGPLLFVEQPALVNTIFVSILIANIAFMLLGLVLMRPVSFMTALPYPALAVGILTLAAAGGIAAGGIAATQIMVIFSVLGVVLRISQFPLAPVVLGLVLGPIMEVYFRRGLLMSDGHILEVFSSPMSIGLLASSSALLLAQPFVAFVVRRRGSKIATD